MSMAFTLDQTAPPDPQAQQTAQPQGQPQTEDVPF
jgi:hypothetical protein